jgi:glycosyltransferase involved in cell wall biosynthesis
MVGTVEPRKNHQLAIQAFEIIVEIFPDIKLVIAGKKGWSSDQLLQELMSSPMYGKSVFWVDSPDDERLRHLYKNSLAILQLSKNEGFGLPLIEAKNFGKNILCSDISIFKEVAKSGATYVNNNDPKILANQIITWLKDYDKDKVPSSVLIPEFNWTNSAKLLMSNIFI